jgi:membrane protease YdiL (CAAX protease family)/LysM repeat protein
MIRLNAAEADHLSARLASLVARSAESALTPQPTVPGESAVLKPAVQPTDENQLRVVYDEPLRGWWLWYGYLVALAAAELLIALRSLEAGLALHLTLLFALPIHATFAPARQQALLLTLVFAPLVRLVSLALPLAGLPIQSWWLLTSIPLFISALAAIRILGFSRQQLGLQIDRLPRQLAIALVGIPLAATEYFILHPAPIVVELSWETVLVPAAVLVISTGFLEELLFRGVMQAAAAPLLGRWGLVYVSVLFAVLHIGYLSVLDVVFVFAVGLGFAWLVARTGSLLGVTLAHGLTNVGLFVVFPVLAAQGIVPLIEPRAPTETLVDNRVPAEPALEVVVRPDQSSLPALRAASPEQPTPAHAEPPDLPMAAPSPLSLPTQMTDNSTRQYEAPLEGGTAAGTPTAAPAPAKPSPTDNVGQTMAQSTASQTADQTEQYVIQPGDTLLRIAAMRGTTVAALVALNGIVDQNRVLAGQTLIISTVWATYVVQPGDSVASIARRTGTTVETLSRVNRLDDTNLIYVGQHLLVPRR